MEDDRTDQHSTPEPFAEAIGALNQAAGALDRAALAHSVEGARDPDVDLLAREVRDVLARVAVKAVEKDPGFAAHLSGAGR